MATQKSKNLLWKIHQWVGLYVGIVIAALSLTGAVAVFLPEIDGLLERKYLLDEAGATFQPVSGIASEIQSKYPKFQILGVQPPQSDLHPLIIDIYKEEAPYDSERYQVFVDPYTAEILGTKDHLNSLSNYLRQIHVRLMDAWWGRQLVGLAGIGLVLLCVTGLLIYGQFMKNQVFGAVRQKNLRLLMADWHKMVGIAALLFNLMIGITGAWLGLQPVLIKWLDIKAPNAYKRPDKPVTADEDILQPYDYWQAIAISKKEIPGFIPTQVVPSKDGTNTLEIKGDAGRLPFEPHISKLVMDKTTLEILDRYDIREQAFLDKFYYIQEGLHFGRFGGILLKIAYALLGITSGVLSITGFFIYLIRKKKTAAEKDRVKKTIFLYSISTILFIVLLGAIVIMVSYAYATMLMTPAVYIFLVAYISFQLFRFWRKEKTTKNPIHENG